MAGPISKGDLLGNIRQADAAMLVLMKAGFAVFNPMLSVYCGGSRPDASGRPGVVTATAHRQANGDFQTLSHQDWLDMDFAWVEACHGLLRLPGESTGADAEVAHANSLGIPVFDGIDDLKSHFGDSP